MDTTKPLYFIAEDGIHRLTFSRLGPVDVVANQIGQQVAVRLPSLYGGHPTRHVAVKQGQLFVSERLPVVKFATHFVAASDDASVLVPTFRETNDSVPLTLDWTVPANMELRFGVTSRGDAGATLFEYYEAFFCARQVGAPTFYRLPLPNVFTDGRVCMGNEDRTRFTRTGSVDTVFASALAHFNSAPWNTDLLEDRLPQAQRMFRFRGSDTLLVADWSAHCSRVSHPTLELLFPL